MVAYNIGNEEPAIILKDKNKFENLKPTIWFAVEDVAIFYKEMLNNGIKFLSEPDVFDLVSSFFSVLPLLLLFLLDTVVFTSLTLTVTVLPSSVFTSTLPSFTSTFLPFLSVMLPSLSTLISPLSTKSLTAFGTVVLGTVVGTVDVCTVEDITDGSVGSFSALQPARMLMPTADMPASIVAPQTTAIT